MITPKKFTSIKMKYGDSLQFGDIPSTYNRFVETADYYINVTSTGLTVIDKTDNVILYNISSRYYRSAAVITGNTVIFTLSTPSGGLIATVGLITDTGITFGVELVLSTIFCSVSGNHTPIVLENGKIIIGYEEHSGSASPYTITPKLANLTFTAPTSLMLYETKTLTSPGTSANAYVGAGLNLYKADVNRIIIITGILPDGGSPGKFQLANVATGGIVLGIQTAASSTSILIGSGTSYSPDYTYCPFPIICDDTNYIIINTIGKASSFVSNFVKVKLSDMTITSVWSGVTTSNVKYSSTISNNKIYICNSIERCVCDKNGVVKSINDTYAVPINSFSDLDAITTVTITPYVMTDDITLYYALTGATARYYIHNIVAASGKNGVVEATGNEITLISGEVGKTKYVTSILIAMFSDYTFMESKVNLLLNGESLMFLRESKLLPNSPIVISEGDVLSIKNFIGVVKGNLTVFGYETTN